MAEITIDDLDNLRHMLGIDRRKARKHWFYRNYFSAAADHPSMNRLENAGWVVSYPYCDSRMFYATELGMRAVGMASEEIKKLKGDR